MTEAGRAWFRRWLDSTAFRVEVVGKDLILIPLPEPVDDYVDVRLARITWPADPAGQGQNAGPGRG